MKKFADFKDKERWLKSILFEKHSIVPQNCKIIPHKWPGLYYAVDTEYKKGYLIFEDKQVVETIAIEKVPGYAPE